MDGKGSYNDNLFIERLWRTVKYEEVYLKAYQDGREARVGIGNYFRFYNTERPHQALGYRTPAEVFNSIPVEATSRSMVESLTSDPLRIVGPNLNIAPILSSAPVPWTASRMQCRYHWFGTFVSFSSLHSPALASRRVPAGLSLLPASSFPQSRRQSGDGCPATGRQLVVILGL